MEILQEGNNSILKKTDNRKNLFAVYNDLVSAVIEQLNLRKLAWVKVPSPKKLSKTNQTSNKNSIKICKSMLNNKIVINTIHVY